MKLSSDLVRSHEMPREVTECRDAIPCADDVISVAVAVACPGCDDRATGKVFVGGEIFVGSEIVASHEDFTASPGFRGP